MADELVDPNGPALQPHLAAGHARGVEQVVEQPRHVRDLTLDHLRDRRRHRCLGCESGEQRGRVADRRERVAQLVREHRQKFLLPEVGGNRRIGEPVRLQRGEHQVFVRLSHHLAVVLRNRLASPVGDALGFLARANRGLAVLQILPAARAAVHVSRPSLLWASASPS